jgi:transcription elongation factor GreA
MSAVPSAPGQEVVQITREGERRLRERLSELTGAKRPELTARLREARGDGTSPADNPELTHALDELMRLERRISELESLLANADIVDGDVPSGGRAAVGTRIVLQPLDARAPLIEYELVGSAEADPALGMLSVESPIGAAALGHRAGETIEVQAPRGPVRFRLEAVEPS